MMSRTITRIARGILTRLTIPTLQQLLFQRATLVCGSFIVLVFVAAIAFWLPFGLTTVPITFVDAWFLATSVLTATGSSTIDIMQECTPLGRAFIIVLLHFGGIGFMTVVLSLLQQFGVRVFRARRISGWRLLIAALGIELWVSLLLAVHWGALSADPLGRWASAFWYASSAFANVGFGGDLGIPTQQLDITATAVLALTMLLGSLGLPVLVDLVTRNRRMAQTSVNTVVTIALVVVTTTAIVLNPLWHVTHEAYTGAEKAFVALVDALSWRTSGYIADQDIMALSVGTRTLILIGMFIGCAPGAMGGGVTPTTFVVFLSGVYRALRGDTTVTLMGQRIAPVVVHRAVSIVGLGILVVLISAGGLWVLDDVSAGAAVMMATAAFATTNIEVVPFAELHPASLALLSIVMLWGRIGVFAIVLTLYGRATPKTVQAQSVWFG
jgi:trk system potassium uptake protein TrkH